MKKIIIAIDGFSSCGKSSFAKAIAKKYNYIFIDTGAMYRATTLYALRNNIIRDGVIDNNAVLLALPEINIHFSEVEGFENPQIILNGENVSDAIRSLEVSQNVSQISSIAEVRYKMVLLQQEMGNKRGVVMDGRDIGTVVFPDAELKIFMTASVDVRADRRYKELIAKGDNVSLDDIKQNISYRDNLDQTREASPLRRAEDALILDNSDMSVEEQMIWVDDIIKNSFVDSRGQK